MKKLITAMLCLMIAVCGCGPSWLRGSLSKGDRAERRRNLGAEGKTKSFLLIHNPPKSRMCSIGDLGDICYNNGRSSVRSK